MYLLTDPRFSGHIYDDLLPSLSACDLDAIACESICINTNIRVLLRRNPHGPQGNNYDTRSATAPRDR